MGKKRMCPECGEEIKDSMKQKMERSMVIKLLKTVKVVGIQEKDEETKGFCYGCWKTALRSMMKPFAQMLGKSAEDW